MTPSKKGDHPPDPADPDTVAHWVARFRSEFTAATRHVALGWPPTPDARAAARPFLASGFSPVHAITLTTAAPRLDRRAATDVHVRPLRSNADWRAATALTQQMHGPTPDRALDQWLDRQLRRHRALVEAGHGAWFGAFAERELVGSLGVYVRRADGLARYQLVVTARRFRRRGVARRLVAEAGLHALAHLGARELVIVAEADGPATEVYRSAGFGGDLPTLGALRRRRGP